MKIGQRVVGDGSPCLIVAEIGSNHDKDLGTAYKLIDMAAEAGADAVKFQTLKSGDIAKVDMPAKAYGETAFSRGKDFWHEVLESFILPLEWHKELFAYAREKGLIVLSTPESPEVVGLLEGLDIPVYKIASMDIDYTQLLSAVAKTKKPVILSAGVATTSDIMEAVTFLEEQGADEIAVLHCVSDYPPKNNRMSLKTIPYFKKVFDCPVGFSDHSEDNLLSGVAVALGANIIEKHITLDKKGLGPDHAFALDHDGLKDLVTTIRTIEQAVPFSEELDKAKSRKRELYGRSIICVRDKRAGDVIATDDLDFKRPGTGISPKHADILVGLTLRTDIEQNHVLTWSDFKS